MGVKRARYPKLLGSSTMLYSVEMLEYYWLSWPLTDFVLGERGKDKRIFFSGL